MLNPICHLLALLGAHPILHVSTIRVKLLKDAMSDYEVIQRGMRREIDRTMNITKK
jgi:hypothetical protein